MAKKKQAELTIEEKLKNALVPEKEQPYKIPDNWCWIRLESLSNIINGDRGKNYPSKKDYVKNGVPFITAGNIEKNNTLNKENLNYISENKYNMLRSGKIVKDDILYCLRGTLGKNAIIDFEFKGAIASSLCIIRLLDKINKKNIYLCLNSILIEHQMIEYNNGTAQPNLSAESLKRYKIPLPPINEQQRIVNRIESLFTKLDKAKELIENTLAQFEQNKMAILHKAFTGELTAKWRKENNIDEGTFFHKIKLKNIIKLISGRDVSVNLCNDKSVGIPYILGASNIRDNKFYVERWIENPVVVSEKNDILLSVKGTIGKLYLQKEEKINISRQIMALRALNELNTHYLYYFLLKECERLKFEGNGLIPGISRKDILGLDIVVPTIEEQQEIVNILDKLLAKYNKIKNLEQQLEKIELLKKAILAKAFRGELGTNNPDEESAEVLLKEILAEK